MPKVLVTSDNSMGSTTVGVNGTNVRIPHNQEVEISDAALEVLQNADLSRTTVKVLDESVDTSADAEVLGSGIQSPAQAYETLQGPATPADTGEGSRQDAPAPADPTAEPPELRQDAPLASPGTATVEATLTTQPAGEGEALHQDSSEQSSQDSSEDTSASTRANAKTFDAETFIARNLDEIGDEVSSLTDEQAAAVLAAEQDREKPRKGLLDALEARKAAE